LAVGQYGIRPNEFWDLTLYEFCLIQDGYLKKAQSEYQTKWEQARWQTFYLLHPRTREAAKIKNPVDLMAFSWEKENKKEDIGEIIRNNIELFDKTFPKYLK